MGIFNRIKQVTDNSKVIQAEVGIVKTDFVMPRFNRRVAVNSYTGFWSAALDYNAQSAASGTLLIYSKVRNSRGQKCLYGTVKHPDIYQRDFMKGMLQDKPASDVQYKIINSLENFEIVQGHPITDLLISANPMQSTYQLFLDIYLNMEITGDAFIFIVSNTDGTPNSLYVLASQYVDIIPARSGSDRVVSHYEYNRGKGKPTKFEADEIIHIKYPNPADPLWYGMGKIEKGFKSFIIDKMSKEWAIALYANHAVPSYLLINKSGNSISKKKWFKNMLNGSRGPNRGGKVMAVDGDISIETIAFKPADMQDTQLNVKEIASISGCPMSKLLGQDQIKANSEVQNTAWLRHTIHPMQKLVASTLTEQLLWRYGIADGDAFLAYDSPVPADREHELKSNDLYVKDGILTPNEIRISLGKEPMENGDVLYHNGIELGKTPEPTANPFNSPSENDNPSPGKSNLDYELKDKIDDIIAKMSENKGFTINVNNGAIVEEVVEESEVIEEE